MFRAFRGMAMGVVENSSKTWKPVQTSIESSLQRSRGSVPMVVGRSQNSPVEERSTSLAAPGYSQMSLELQGSIAE